MLELKKHDVHVGVGQWDIEEASAQVLGRMWAVVSGHPQRA